jgi:hypothetical protein
MSSRPQVLVVAVAAVLFVTPHSSAIVNGTIDTGYECVGSLHTPAAFLCTGTLIDSQWVLTSAACASSLPNLFAMGADWTSSPRIYLVDFWIVHPSYDGDLYDFGLLHLGTPAIGEPICSLATTPDNLSGGTPFTTVGFGLTSLPSGSTTLRHRAAGAVFSLEALRFYFNYGSGLAGPCSGDEGAPNLAGNPELVVGVVSSFDCSTFAVSGRVATVVDWIVITVTNWTGIYFDGFETGDTVAWSENGS